ncbi:hypothetical protein D5S18_07975 [Nocardia panacis]|uniref:Uncharacterized protein n=1 Tax=Nocardia panacis TaxID=2340916 RepID=A0A3A4KLB8_9NOCA|nr:hypothetical protein [Nocardia panacis]RJO77662.1 hypothetical protein D5S18_07975 [Nocardia panacis]
MTEVSFTVTDVFDIPTRAGLLVAGQLASGDITVGDVLHDASTGASATVIGIELHGHREPGRYTLVIDRQADIRIGQHLVAPVSQIDEKTR